MTHKDIKRKIRKELKKKYPNWRKLKKKQKKAIAKEVLNEAVAEYDFNKPVEAPIPELLGIENQAAVTSNLGIMTIVDMEKYIADQHNSRLFRISDKSGHPAIKDKELRLTDEILDDRIINKILSYKGFTPSMREYMPSMFLRAELLKTVKYPEISYRKFSGDNGDYECHKKHNAFTGKEQKETRAFIGLQLNANQFFSHVQMCQFRSSLTFEQQVNLTVYILCCFNKSGLLKNGALHCVDSTELAVDSVRPLASLKVRGEKYTDL